MSTAENLYKKLKDIHFGETGTDLMEHCRSWAPLVDEINSLKAEKNAVILAHTYVPPEIIYGVADHVGDSYGLSKKAMESHQEMIVFPSVKFMGDTAKILSPEKKVIVPALDGGCSLADSITGDQVRALKENYPDYAVSCYINTTADVKAECDFSVTSSNVFDIFQHYPSDKIIFLPDRLMGQNIINELKRRGVDKDIILTDGSCYVHEEYTADMVRAEKEKYPNLRILAHPECDPEVIALSDYVGSTTQIYEQMKEEKGRDFLILSERGLTSRIESEIPGQWNIAGPVKECKYMRSNSLDEILRVLKNPQERDFIEIDEDIRSRAEKCIKKMFEIVDRYCQ